MEEREELIRLIDNAADSARQRIVGDAVRVIEYQVAEADALAYKSSSDSCPFAPAVAVCAQSK